MLTPEEIAKAIRAVEMTDALLPMAGENELLLAHIRRGERAVAT